MVNFLALLGWNPGNDQEIMSMDELISLFSFEHCSRNGAKFDFEKGKWFNHQYLQLRSNEQLATEFLAAMPEEAKLLTEAQKAQLPHVIGLVKERVNFVSELWEQMSFFFVAPTEYDEKSLKKRWKEDSPKHMTELVAILEKQDDWSAEALDTAVMGWIAQQGYGVGIVMNAFRICLVGAARGPHIWEITNVLGKEETIRRVKEALLIMN